MSLIAAAAKQSLIPTKATGTYGKEFYSDQPMQPMSLNLLKKKEHHKELQDKGYLIQEHIKSELDMDLPMYEVFDAPNQNYRQLFHPRDLTPMVGYNYHSPDFHQNELFLIPKDEQQLVEQQLKAKNDETRQREFKLLRLNQRHKAEREIEELQQLRQQQEAVIQNFKANRQVKQVQSLKPTKTKQVPIQVVGAKGKLASQYRTPKKVVTFADEEDELASLAKPNRKY